MTKLLIAYFKWVSYQPIFDCCDRRHLTDRGHLLPDNEVCPREKAWRDYVRLRDQIDRFN